MASDPMSTTPTPEAPSPELLRIHNAGQLLANCAFNIAQHAGEPISESVAATLKQCQTEWDAACLAFKAARAALTQGAGAAEPDSREVVSDDDLEQAFRNTNFGGADHRTLLHVGVLKKACGYHCGHTITTIMAELGLIGIGGVPTKKGRRMMQIAYHAQMLKGP